MRIALTRIAIGNGILKPAEQYASTAEYARALGLISAPQAAAAAAAYAECARQKAAGDAIGAFGLCQATEDEMYEQWAGNPFIYDVRQPNGVFDALTAVMARYFNAPEARTTFNVGAQPVRAVVATNIYIYLSI